MPNNLVSEHLSAAEMFQFLNEELPLDRAHSIAEHIDVCAECQSALAKLCDPSKSMAELLQQSDAFNACALTQKPTEQRTKKNPTVSFAKQSLDASCCGRYSLRHPIAIGGMGEIFCGWDDQLQREVAIKLVLNHHNQPQVERFQREAVISARLQHPGIVPVYSVGKIGSRDFIAMKLISGQTLSHLLKQNSSDTPDANRRIEIFYQITQTVAYAHSQGFIHRDLKPDNIMVGEFGEVQVMDWGLAKCINDDTDTLIDETSPIQSSLQTCNGSIMGTPAYMPPEQALGEPTDKRSDVFALGSILCEILTNRPPFAMDSSTVAVDQSANFDLQDAISRLKNCDADPFLIDLAMRCIAPRADDRPDDAAQVSQMLSEYFLQRDRRLRQADLERARAEERDAAEAKRKKQATILGAIVISFLLLSAVSVMLYFAEKARRQSDQLAIDRAAYEKRIAGENDIRKQLAKVNSLQQSAANATGSEQSAAWNKALIVLKKAESLVELGTDANLIDQIKHRQQFFEGSIADAQRQSRQRKREQQFIQSLVDITRRSKIPNLRMKIKANDSIRDEIAATLATFGITIGSDLNGTAEFIQQSNIKNKIIDGLRLWRNQTIRLRLANEHMLDWTDRLLDQIDGTEIHVQLRKLSRFPEPESIHRLVSLPGAKKSIQSVHWAIDCIQQLGDRKLMVDFLELAHLQYASDFEVNWHLGASHLKIPRRSQKALHHFYACLSIEPEHPGVLLNISSSYESQGMSHESLRFAKQLVEIAPQYPQPHVNLVAAYVAIGEFQKAIEVGDRALESAPDNAVLHNNKCVAYINLRQFKKALHEIDRAIEMAPKEPNFKMRRCRVLAELNRFDEALQLGEATIKNKRVRPKGYMDMAFVHVRMKNWDKAIKYAKEWKKRQPDYWKTYMLLAQIQTNTRQYREAMNTIAEATNRGIRNYNLIYQVALIRKRMGKKNDAIVLCRKILANVPNHESAKRLLERLTRTSKADRPEPDTKKNLK